MTDEFVDLKEFVNDGYLQELNRKFLHPLGLSLEVNRYKDGSVSFRGIRDLRSNPETCDFPAAILDNDVAREKARRVASTRAEAAHVRRKQLGYVVQPLPGVDGAAEGNQ